MTESITTTTAQPFLDYMDTIVDFDAFDLGHRPIAYPTYDLSSYLKAGTVLDERNPDLPEYVPYHLEERNTSEVQEKGLWKKMMQGCSICKDYGIQWAKHTHSRVRNYFNETQFSLLMRLGKEREIRATKSFVSPERGEKLYGLSSWSFHQWLGFNTLVQLFNEGIFFARSPLANVSKIAEITPRILVSRAKEIQREFESLLEPTLRQAAVVLKDDHYEDVEFLEALWNCLQGQLTLFRQEATDLEIDNDKFGTTQMKAAQNRFTQLFEEAEASKSSWINESKWYQVNELKVSLAKFFKVGDQYSDTVREGLRKIVLSSGQSKLPTLAERLRENIANLVKDIYALKVETGEQVDEMVKLLEFFEADRKDRVRF